MCVRVGVQLQVLHVLTVQLGVDLVQGVLTLAQGHLQAVDPLHVLLHQRRLTRTHRESTREGERDGEEKKRQTRRDTKKESERERVRVRR